MLVQPELEARKNLRCASLVTNDHLDQRVLRIMVHSPKHESWLQDDRSFCCTVVGTDTFANIAAESRCSQRGETDGGCGRSFFY